MKKKNKDRIKALESARDEWHDEADTSIRKLREDLDALESALNVQAKNDWRDGDRITALEKRTKGIEDGRSTLDRVNVRVRSLEHERKAHDDALNQLRDYVNAHGARIDAVESERYAASVTALYERVETLERAAENLKYDSRLDNVEQRASMTWNQSAEHQNRLRALEERRASFETWADNMGRRHDAVAMRHDDRIETLEQADESRARGINQLFARIETLDQRAADVDLAIPAHRIKNLEERLAELGDFETRMAGFDEAAMRLAERVGRLELERGEDHARADAHNHYPVLERLETLEQQFGERVGRLEELKEVVQRDLESRTAGTEARPETGDAFTAGLPSGKPTGYDDKPPGTTLGGGLRPPASHLVDYGDRIEALEEFNEVIQRDHDAMAKLVAKQDEQVTSLANACANMLGRLEQIELDRMTEATE